MTDARVPTIMLPIPARVYDAANEAQTRNLIALGLGAVQRTLSVPSAYASLPTGSGTWDTGAGTTITIAESLTVVGTLTGTLTGTATKVSHALTAGTHLSGGPFDGSGAVTLTTDAASLDTPSTLVARDASGNFTANVVTLAGSLVMSAAAGFITPGATSFNITNHAASRNNLAIPDAGGLALNCSGGEILNYTATAQNGDMPAGGFLSNSSTVASHRALSIFANDGTPAVTVGAYYFTQSAVETVWQYANATGKVTFSVTPKGGETQFGNNYSGSGSNIARVRLFGTTTSNAGGTAALIVQQGGISTDTLAASALISANGGLTVASGKTLTLTGATVTGLAWSSLGSTPTTLSGYGITSPLDVAEGGTAIASYTTGDTLYASGSTALSKLAIGAANTVLTSSGTAPQWSTSLTLAGSLTVTGTTQLTGAVGIGSTPVSNIGLRVVPSVTASAGAAVGLAMTATLTAAANADSLISLSCGVAAVPGSFTGLALIGYSVPTMSLVGFTSPFEVIGVSFGTMNGTGAPNAYSIKFGAGPSGATNNYLIHATNFQLTSAGAATFAGASTFSSTLNVVGNFAVNTSKFTANATSGDLATAGLVATYNGVATAGFGVPAIYASGRKTAQSAASGTVCTFTPAADGTFQIGANVLVTAATLASFTVTCTYTDESNTAQTLTLTFSQVSGTLLTTITNATGTGAYEGVPLRIRAKGATAITIQTAAGGTYTTVTYNISASIEQLAA